MTLEPPMRSFALYEDEVDPDHIAEVKRITGIKPKRSPYARHTEVYEIGYDQEEKTTPLELRD
jgi:hypothetical protein